MAIFSYVGRNASGSQVKGKIEAKNANTVAEQLSRQGIIPVAINKSKDSGSTDIANIDIGDLLGFSVISLDELIVFCRQMYALVRSGVPILRAINGMAESSTSDKLKVALTDIGSQLEGGYTLSTALSQFPKLFSPLFVSLVHVGENTGQLDGSFLKLANYLEREQDTRKRIKTALRYPSFVLGAIVIAMVILNIFVVPTFANMFAKLGADLPVTTKMLIASSNFFLNYWPHLLVGSVFGFFGLQHYLKTERGMYLWDRLKTKIPVVGGVIERSILSRFSHTFAIVLKAGVPLTTGLTLVADAVDNTYMRDKILAMRGGIESGDSLLRSASVSKLFTPLVLQMVAVGEETGRVDELLEEVGDYYEREVDYELSTLTARIEPIMIAIVAAMVLVLALGIFTPMWDMMSALKGT
ncbi:MULTISPECIES: type II secretion system F family protein [unclassified Colwellia]|jgi:MSHA biogenesis protein MshG|uniref:type II secretion system F family protein n=1 Tax=unclassified Colwellia TaxID=196834 RepID=UPI0015F5D6F1|nr:MULTISPECIES: type II secretion system F family protein [unclassified Colwellia]MBA6253083.1 type II secretion system F family protein [Colwellia sp. MB3u-55]MBA6397745.1 type II secretion system F family protein [Colwellia sp. BRX10-4]